MSILSPEAALQGLKPREPIFHRQHGMIRGALEGRTGDTGTGLGLATVHEMVRDGAMNVLSESGRGSGFEAWLPAGQQTPLRRQTRPSNLSAMASTTDLSVDALANAGITGLLRRPLTSADLANALARGIRSRGALQS
jgi:hypothetical protein